MAYFRKCGFRVFAVVIGLALLLSMEQVGPVGAATVASQGSAEDIDGTFALTDHLGRRVTNKDFLGRYTLVFFGYTYCPDVCPIGLTNMAGTLDLLGDDAKKIQPLFITLDPERDVVERVAEYVAAFDSRIIGLTGTPEDIFNAADAFSVVYYKVRYENRDRDDEYSISHTADVYVMGPDGAYIGSLGYDDPPERSAGVIREILNGTQ